MRIYIFGNQILLAWNKLTVIKRLFLSSPIFCAMLLLSACPVSDEQSDQAAVESASANDATPSVKKELLTKIDERGTIHPANSILGIHKFEQYPEGTPFSAATSANGRRVFFADKSVKEKEFAVFSVEMPGNDAVQVFSIPSIPEKLVVSRNGTTVFALCKEGGFLYSYNERRLFARIDYDHAKEAYAISPDGMVFSCWGGVDKTPYNYTRYFDNLSSTPFWENPKPSDRSDVYGIDPVLLLPSFGLTQIIVQVGNIMNPSFTFVTMNTHQHGYKATNAISGFLSRGSLSQDGLVYRALYSPPESSLAISSAGEVPYTHRAIIELSSLGFTLEPLKTVITGAPIAIDRLAQLYLIKNELGDIEVRNFDTNKPVYLVSKEMIGDAVILDWATDLQGILVVADNELRWVDVTRFQATS